MANDNSKDVANTLNKYTDYAHKGTNLALDSVDNINKWYAEKLKEISEGEVEETRLETGVDNSVTDDNKELKVRKIETKVEQYDEIQTNGAEVKSHFKAQGIQTESNEDNDWKTLAEKGQDKILEKNKRKIQTSKGISKVIKGAKVINNSAQRAIKTGKDISTGLNENSTSSFKSSSSRIMTRATEKVGKKVNKKVGKYSKKVGKKVGKKVSQKAAKESANLMVKLTKLIIKLIAKVTNLILSLLPSIAPILIIIIAIAAFCSFFGIGMSKDTKKSYEQYMMKVQDDYDKSTVDYYKSGKVVDGTVEGKGMINWRVPLSILQMLNGDLTFDFAELEMLENFRKANLYERIKEVEYTYDKEVVVDGKKVMQRVTEKKKVAEYASIQEVIAWCNEHYDLIKQYKQRKHLEYDHNQNKFTDDEVEQIMLLYKSNSFFDLFSSEFKNKYAYLTVKIGDEQIQAIYDEFLRNVGKRYLMDHSNLDYDNCMEYYDCSSWVIHCLAHTGIARIPNSGAKGIYDNYCTPIDVNNRQAGDLIFLKDTYDTGDPGGISHIGIYMGTMTINNETAEWVIDTGGNPSGVRIRRYDNGWWNGSNFYGFGRLKQE